MPAVAHKVVATLLAYRRGCSDVSLTLIDVTTDLMHLASHMRADFERCLDGDARARLDERPLSAMPNLAPSVMPIDNTKESAAGDHLFDLYVHTSDAAAVLRVHMEDTAYPTFSKALYVLLNDLRAYAHGIGIDFEGVMHAASHLYRTDQRKAE
ncbi:hypothetical protein [Streptomyces clavuligerus]|uniref:hypothetical protein n=1 Tax=Streptomyces clavuligerus TaxID=1901 RepID=UPI000180077E|nr:hypothetical protein [Streptomyces clavuligerus]EDY53276.1 hypothetical protein SSCG_06304 [Streptomyces clavuligerus]WDN56193.1 hypothetical protein LL058_30545 [Streptomyces clavuligerus]